MGHTEIGVTMNVCGHLFEGKQRELTSDLNDLLDRPRLKRTHGAEYGGTTSRPGDVRDAS